MIGKIDRRENGWFLDERRLPEIDVGTSNHYRQEGYWSGKTLGDVIEEAARKWPDRTALVCGDRRVSYQELDILSTRLALGFVDIGLRPRDMVAVQLPNIVEHALTIAALGKMGAVCNTIVPIMRGKRGNVHTESLQVKGHHHSPRVSQVRPLYDDQGYRFSHSFFRAGHRCG